jgi:hypothetical protein
LFKMALEGCYNCLKYLMFVFNFIFWLVGSALLAVGIWAKVDERSLTDLIRDPTVTSHLNVAAWILIVIGSIIMVLGFLGCCGAIRESQCMLATFFVFLFIIFAALLTVGIYVYVYFDDPEKLKAGEKKLSDCVAKYYNDTVCKDLLDDLNKQLGCCGAVKGDFAQQYGPVKAADACGLQYLTEDGCSDSIKKKIKDYFVIFVAIAFGVATVMLLGMIFAMMLCCAIREAMA